MADLTPDDEQGSVIDALHRAAEEAGLATYRDPATGYEVMTATTLAARGQCCGSGCRHCPYPSAAQRSAGRPGAEDRAP